MGERVMYVDEGTPVNCVFPVRLRGHVSREGLQAALDGLQRKHPLLRASIGQEGARPYFLLQGEAFPIPIREVERRSESYWLAVVQEEWKERFDGEAGPLARLVWVRGTGASGRPGDEAGREMGTGDGSTDFISELILVCPHCICDGMTGVTLMRELLSLLDKPGLKLGSYERFGSVDELLPDLPPLTRAGRWKMHFFVTLGRLFYRCMSLQSLPERGADYVLHWRVDGRKVDALARRCKEEGVGLYAVLCVCWLEAFQSIRPKAARNKVICPVDIRRYVPSIGADNMFAFAPIVNLSVARKVEGVWSRARAMRVSMEDKVGKLKAGELLRAGELFHGAVRDVVRHMRTNVGGHDLTFSNMGRLDIPGKYKGFVVEKVFSPTVVFPWKNPTTLVTSSYGGEMDFAFVSNESYLPEGEAEAIRAKAMELLFS